MLCSGKPLPHQLVSSLASSLLLPLGLGVLVVAWPQVTPASEATAQPIRLATEAFDSTARVEVRDLPEGVAEKAAQAALEEVLRLEELLAPLPPEGGGLDAVPEGGVASLNARAGSGPQEVEPQVVELLARAVDFCQWSRRANGPLGGRLYELWGLRGEAVARPDPRTLRNAAASAACDRLELNRGTASSPATVTLAAGSRLELWPFTLGWAVDRAVAMLKEHGATNGWAQVGPVQRGFGPGPEGRGWPARLPVVYGQSQPLGELWLQEEALAIAHVEDRLVTLAGDTIPPYVDQRTGEPVTGVVAVIVRSERAVDAHGLATTLFITGNKKGQFLVGQLQPLPAVRWLLGSGQGRPLLVDYNWSDTR